MKQYVLKREKIFHFSSLIFVAVSVFMQEAELKVALLLLGIMGLLLIAIVKKQVALISVYALLMVAALVFYYLTITGKIQTLI